MKLRRDAVQGFGLGLLCCGPQPATSLLSAQHRYCKRMRKLFDLAIAGEADLNLILYGLPLEMPPERELLATGMVATLGGSAVIVAHNAAMLGLAVQFTTVVGDDAFGRVALDRLREAKVDVSGAALSPEHGTGVSVLLPHDGPRHTLGCRVVHGREMFDVPGLQVETVDTVGAGDSFDAGFLTAYLRGCDLRELAMYAGAMSMQGSGGTEAFRDAALRDAFLTKHEFCGDEAPL